jgi:hypothetical protein
MVLASELNSTDSGYGEIAVSFARGNKMISLEEVKYPD